jgi:hypothetical protein
MARIPLSMWTVHDDSYCAAAARPAGVGFSSTGSTALPTHRTRSPTRCRAGSWSPPAGCRDCSSGGPARSTAAGSAGSTSPSATAQRWPAVASRAAPGAPRGRALPDRRDAIRAPAWARRRAGLEAPERHQPTGTRPHRATRTGTPTSRNRPAGYRSARGIRFDTEEIAFADCAISPSLALAHPITTQTLCRCDATNVRRRCEASRCCLAHVPHQSPDAPARQGRYRGSCHM